jgi:ATP-dependent protease Clp ATPase subunit
VGARGLRMILEELMLDLMYHLPNNKRVRDLEITKDMVERRDLSLCLLEKAGYSMALSRVRTTTGLFLSGRANS